MSCNGAIVPGEPVACIRFDRDDHYHLDRLNGVYHAACAAPLQTVIRALNTLRDLPF